MFTGIIQSLGTVTSSELHGSNLRIKVTGIKDDWNLAIGDSVACNGVCLTILSQDGEVGAFDVGLETRQLLGDEIWKTGKSVNLEPALKMGDALGGHQVSGHVDALCTVLERSAANPDAEGEPVDGIEFWLSLPPDLRPFALHKGSITLNGISLTINELHEDRFRINLIPHTLKVTNSAAWQPGDSITIEADHAVKIAHQTLRQMVEQGALQKMLSQ